MENAYERLERKLNEWKQMHPEGDVDEARRQYLMKAASPEERAEYTIKAQEKAGAQQRSVRGRVATQQNIAQANNEAQRLLNPTTMQKIEAFGAGASQGLGEKLTGLMGGLAEGQGELENASFTEKFNAAEKVAQEENARKAEAAPNIALGGDLTSMALQSYLPFKAAGGIGATTNLGLLAKTALPPVAEGAFQGWAHSSEGDRLAPTVAGGALGLLPGGILARKQLNSLTGRAYNSMVPKGIKDFSSWMKETPAAPPMPEASLQKLIEEADRSPPKAPIGGRRVDLPPAKQPPDMSVGEFADMPIENAGGQIQDISPATLQQLQSEAVLPVQRPPAQPRAPIDLPDTATTAPMKDLASLSQEATEALPFRPEDVEPLIPRRFAPDGTRILKDMAQQGDTMVDTSYRSDLFDSATDPGTVVGRISRGSADTSFDLPKTQTGTAPKAQVPEPIDLPTLRDELKLGPKRQYQKPQVASPTEVRRTFREVKELLPEEMKAAHPKNKLSGVGPQAQAVKMQKLAHDILDGKIEPIPGFPEPGDTAGLVRWSVDQAGVGNLKGLAKLLRQPIEKVRAQVKTMGPPYSELPEK